MKNFLRFILAAGVIACAVPMIQAQDLNAVKARIKERLSSLDALKVSGAVGENNRGLVEVRGSGADAASVVAAENSDREAVYAAIAQKTGSTPEAVGQARARKIAAESAPGVWIQKDDGSWAKK